MPRKLTLLGKGSSDIGTRGLHCYSFVSQQAFFCTIMTADGHKFKSSRVESISDEPNFFGGRSWKIKSNSDSDPNPPFRCA